MRVLLIAVALPGLGGCANKLAEIGQAPTMSPVGQGLQVDARGIPMEKRAHRGTGHHSIWNERKDLYRDPRAARIGDILTVNVVMNDKAILDNKTDRSRDAQIKLGTDYAADVAKWISAGSFDANVSSQSSSKGSGKIDRAEEVRFSIAAVVVDVMPNGNLLISGSQEMRVNYEMRIVNVGGIVRPIDVARNNTVPYEKIAEARISYGGRGRIMEVQQPNWGQQVYDQVAPF
ncbi:flagellar basal body L-ring protein FlgH [Tardiphaga sp.]|uniref:flagellar basal body L-ring protein FlgH n=1 Tax=Tardiphaga sp. TaxID=1926292 RepID=UPI0037DA5041